MKNDICLCKTIRNERPGDCIIKEIREVPSKLEI